MSIVNGNYFPVSRKSSQMNGASDQMCSPSSASNSGTEKKVKMEPIYDVVAHL